GDARRVFRGPSGDSSQLGPRVWPTPGPCQAVRILCGYRWLRWQSERRSAHIGDTGTDAYGGSAKARTRKACCCDAAKLGRYEYFAAIDSPEKRCVSR